MAYPTPFDPANINGNLMSTQYANIPTVTSNGTVVTASTTLVNANLAVIETGGIKQ
jgi:hypothetical protein